MEILDKFGPAYVAISVVHNDFFNYKGGIYAHPSRPKDMCDPARTSKKIDSFEKLVFIQINILLFKITQY